MKTTTIEEKKRLELEAWGREHAKGLLQMVVDSLDHPEPKGEDGYGKAFETIEDLRAFRKKQRS